MARRREDGCRGGDTEQPPATYIGSGHPATNLVLTDNNGVPPRRGEQHKGGEEPTLGARLYPEERNSIEEEETTAVETFHPEESNSIRRDEEPKPGGRFHPEKVVSERIFKTIHQSDRTKRRRDYCRDRKTVRR